MITHTGTKKKEYNEKGQYFVVTHFRKWNILYRFITQSEIFQAFISWNFDDYDFQIMKPEIRCLRKFEYYIRSMEKKGYFKQTCQASAKYVHFYALNTW